MLNNEEHKSERADMNKQLRQMTHKLSEIDSLALDIEDKVNRIEQTVNGKADTRHVNRVEQELDMYATQK
jgi:hypothetical protein